MKKVMCLMILLLGCATNSNSKELEQVKQDQQISREDLRITKDKVKEEFRRLDYYIDHDKCFISYSVCLGENKKTKQQCWDIHEKCVVSVFHQWKK